MASVQEKLRQAFDLAEAQAPNSLRQALGLYKEVVHEEPTLYPAGTTLAASTSS